MTPTRRLAAILAADVSGYSRLIGTDEEGTLNRLRSIRADVIDPKIIENRGRIVKTSGDGLLVEFSSVVDALRCATEWQQGMYERHDDVPPTSRIEFRMGINVGNVVVEDGDIFGDGVNVAARLEGLAEPGGICVSARVQEDIAGRLDLTFDDLGDRNLKNIARSVRVYRVRLAEAENTPESAAIDGTRWLPLPDKPSIAVLPFANMSGDPEQEYFADGMVEEIITAISRIRWLFVIARNSSFTYKGQAVDVKQVGRELGVRYVLEGSIRRAGERVRITAQLIDAVTGNHVWAERYDREFADIFAVQDDITERVVGAVEPELYAAEHFRSQRKPPESLDAWECVMRALSSVGQGTHAGNTEAEALCRRAIAIAPRYAQAHSLLAWVLVRGADWSADVRAILPEAAAAARTALGFDERDPWAHLTRGIVFWRMRRHDEAARAYRRALELNPNFALAHALIGIPLVTQGGHEEAIQRANQALRLSPNDGSVGYYASIAILNAHFAAGRYADCVVWARSAIERNSGQTWGYVLLIASAAMQPDIQVAAEALATMLLLRPDFSLAWASTQTTWTGEMRERFLEGLRKAGVPEG